MSIIKNYYNNIFLSIVLVLITVVLTISILFLSPIKHYGYSDKNDNHVVNEFFTKGNISPLLSFGQIFENKEYSHSDLQQYLQLFENAVNSVKIEMNSRLSNFNSFNNEVDDSLSNFENFNEVEEKEASEIERLNSMEGKEEVVLQEIITPSIEIKLSDKELENSTSEIVKLIPVETFVKPNKIKSKSKNSFDEDDVRFIGEIDQVVIEEQPEVIQDETTEVLLEYKVKESPEDNLELNILIVDNEVSVITIDPSEDDIEESSFSSNPCYSEAARYIKKCVRFFRSQRKQ